MKAKSILGEIKGYQAKTHSEKWVQWGFFFLIFIPIIAFFWMGQAKSESMYPEIKKGDLMVFTMLKEAERGDIVCYNKPYKFEQLVKRVVGLPGEVIMSRDGVVTINDKPLDEPYATPSFDFGPLKVPKGQVFLMGDNRNFSYDSRGFGPVPLEHITGPMIFKQHFFETKPE